MTTATETLIMAPEIATATREDHPDKASWLQARTLGLGGSDAPVILGKSPYKSALSLYSEKIGITEPPDVRNDAADWGIILEGPVADQYARQAGKTLYYPGPYTIYRSKRTSFLAASFDRLILHEDRVQGVLQVKTTGAWHEEEWETDVPLHVVIQVHHEMIVAGVQEAGDDFRWMYWGMCCVSALGRAAEGASVKTYCGCCGRVIVWQSVWCARCERHVARHGELWNRTYFAQYGKDCPYQVNRGGEQLKK